MIFFPIFYIRFVYRTSFFFFFFNSSYKNYHVKKIRESHSKGQHLCILIRFVNEPGHPMKNSRKKIQQTRSAAGRCTRGSAVQTSGNDTHTFHWTSLRKKTKTCLLQVNWRIDCEFRVCFCKRCRGIRALSPRPPPPTREEMLSSPTKSQHNSERHLRKETSRSSWLSNIQTCW